VCVRAAGLSGVPTLIGQVVVCPRCMALHGARSHAFLDAGEAGVRNKRYIEAVLT
jgi:hypothetical protein